MSDYPGRSTPDPRHANSPKGRSGPRHIGEYLLVAQLGDDALGSVYRALRTSDGHFVRLRVLQSTELSLPAIWPGEAARCGELQVADGTLYLVWPERSGWTLDFVLARARAGGWGLPTEFALSIAERAAATIDQATLLAGPGAPSFHGALWPGFVSVTSDAEVCIDGFGLAQVILPSLSKPQMWRDIAPYIAPEVRETGRANASADVYSIGVLLTELLTGQRASADIPPPRWRADDDFSEELSLLLRSALADPPERFSSIHKLHTSLRQLQASSPFETSPADLALFFYELLNPESRRLPAPFDGSSTRPVADRRPTKPAQECLPPVSLSSIPAAPAPHMHDLSDHRHRRTQVDAAIEQQTWNPLAMFGSGSSTRSVSFLRWGSRAAAIAAAVTGLILVDLPNRRTAVSAPPEMVAPTRLPAPYRPSSTEAAVIGVVQPASIVSRSPSRHALVPRRSVVRHAASKQQAPSDVRQQPPSEVVKPDAETLRLKAALARIRAERIDASVHAADTFLQGTAEEREAQRLLSLGQYAAAHDAYARALELFLSAETRSREERVRQIQIASDASAR